MNKPRVFISTDLGGMDPDDHQSLVHLLLYADVLEINGLVSSPPGVGRVKDILEVLDAYENDYDALLTWGDYPKPQALRDVCKQGLTQPQLEDVPDAHLSLGAQHLIQCAQKREDHLLYVLVWGSITDVAQAVHLCPHIKKNIRVYYIGSWNTKMDPKAWEYLVREHPDLWVIENNFTFRGIYRGNDVQNLDFPMAHLKGHGTLGELFMQKKPDIKMGDTPSVLYMLSPIVGGVGDWSDPTQPSWGGTFKKSSRGTHTFTDLFGNMDDDQSSVAQYREAFLKDFAMRTKRLLPL